MLQAVAHIPISRASTSNQGKLCFTDNRSVVKDSARGYHRLKNWGYRNLQRLVFTAVLIL